MTFRLRILNAVLLFGEAITCVDHEVVEIRRHHVICPPLPPPTAVAPAIHCCACGYMGETLTDEARADLLACAILE